MNTVVSEGLIEARGLVAHGWTQTRYEDNHGRYCTRGAIGMAFVGDSFGHYCIGNTQPEQALGVAEELIRQVIGRPTVDHIESWNDLLRGPWKKRKVLKAFDAAIKEAQHLEADAIAAETFEPFEVQIFLSEGSVVDASELAVT